MYILPDSNQVRTGYVSQAATDEINVESLRDDSQLTVM